MYLYVMVNRLANLLFLCRSTCHEILAFYALPFEEEATDEAQRTNCNWENERGGDGRVIGLECCLQLVRRDNGTKSLSTLHAK